MPSFSRCRAGILLSHSVYTGITINPGMGEVDQHPGRTFNYQGTVAQEGKRQESFRRVRPVSFESPRYRRAIRPFPILSLSPSLSRRFRFTLVFSSDRPYVISSTTGRGTVFYETARRDREDQMIPIAHYRESKFPLFFFSNAANFFTSLDFGIFISDLSLYPGEICPIARKEEREGDVGHRSE